MDHLQDKRQKHVCRNLCSSQCVYEGIAIFTPVVVLVARHNAIPEFNQDRLPVPEPPVPNREDYRWYGKSPDEEINSNIPPRMDRPALSLEKSEEEVQGVIEEGE